MCEHQQDTYDLQQPITDSCIIFEATVFKLPRHNVRASYSNGHVVRPSVRLSVCRMRKSPKLSEIDVYGY